ncbi:MAG TPA: histidine kinase N-terminal 7TM domain-containing protein [Natrialbaceae archaeon]|nr:histidine kinase N-terminal 7TM domain-containing protein [Natrialbaceae archaeon]
MAGSFANPLVLMGFAVIVAAYVGVTAWRNRPDAGTIPITGLMAGVIVWLLAVLASGLTDSYRWSVRLYALVYVGIGILPPAVLLFALEFTGREGRISNHLLGALAIEPTLVLAILATNRWHGWFWSEVWSTSATITGFTIRGGIAYDLNTVYSYALILAGIALLLGTMYRSSSLYRRQTVAIVAGFLAPMIANGLYHFEVTPADLTPVGFVVTGVLFFWAIRRYRLTEIAPVARDTLVDNIRDGILVVDDRGNVVDANPQVGEMFGFTPEAAIGTSVDSALGAHPELVETIVDRYQGTAELELQTRRGLRHYDVRISPVKDRRDRTVGRLVLIHDVTDRRRHEQELERQNDQLEQFASFLSHDLRNPLTVARGYVQAARDADDISYLDEVERSHDRMESMIEEALTYAREGQSIDDTEPTELETFARRAWGNVDTKEASLSVTTALTVDADRQRLLRILENLYRNAVQHVGDDVSVTVGDLSGETHGFYVEDDGPGIPVAKRDSVLETGVTTDEEGSGFGLAIVRTIAEAHGWDVRVVEGTDGGARFEFTGVTLAATTAKAT